jgi:hypothetical protein
MLTVAAKSIINVQIDYSGYDSLIGSYAGPDRLDWGFTAHQQYLSHFEPPQEVGKIQCDTGVCHLVLLRAL